jgi:very-short-patch-repair endonuclease
MPRAPLFYNAGPLTFSNAQSLRRQMTIAEKVLWKMLRGNKVRGLYFRRQHPIDCFIADFYCHKAKLVVEVDGTVHDSLEAKEYDENRTAFMEKLGLKVLRFSNGDVLRNPNLVISEIEKCLEST